MPPSENSDFAQDEYPRARHRKSGWNFLSLLLGFLDIGIAWYLLAQIFLSYQKLLYPPGAFLSSGTRIGNILMYASPVFPSLAIGFLIGNAFVWCIPWAREALQREADFRSSQRGLAKFGLLLSPILLLSLLGANNFWALTTENINYRPMFSPVTRKYVWSEVQSINTGCTVRKIIDYNFVMTLRDGTRIDLAQEKRDEFWTAYPQIQQSLTGVNYRFSSEDLYGPCLNRGSKRWLELLSQRPTPP
jgi:hypothetical protein